MVAAVGTGGYVPSSMRLYNDIPRILFACSFVTTVTSFSSRVPLLRSPFQYIVVHTLLKPFQLLLIILFLSGSWWLHYIFDMNGTLVKCQPPFIDLGAEYMKLGGLLNSLLRWTWLQLRVSL